MSIEKQYLFTHTLPSLLATIQRSKDPISGAWKTYGHARNSSLHSWADTLPSLDTVVTQAVTRQGLEQTVRDIQTLTDTLVRTVNAPESLRRTPVYSTSKGALNPHRVLRGSSAYWRTTSPVRKAAMGRQVTLCIPGSFPARTPHTTIRWACIATSALADILQMAGYQVSLVACLMSKGLFQATAAQTATVVMLRDNSQAWDLYSLAVVAEATFCRRLCFRFWETLIPRHGALSGNYGTVCLDPDAIQDAVTQAYPGIGTCTIGAGPWAHVTSQASAQQWVEAQLQTLTS